MENHLHVVVHTPQANLVQGMQWFMNAYTRRLFGDRYKSLAIEALEHEGETDYLRSALW